MTKLLNALIFWRRRKTHEREWYRRQEDAIREGIANEDASQTPNAVSPNRS